MGHARNIKNKKIPYLPSQVDLPESKYFAKDETKDAKTEKRFPIQENGCLYSDSSFNSIIESKNLQSKLEKEKKDALKIKGKAFLHRIKKQDLQKMSDLKDIAELKSRDTSYDIIALEKPGEKIKYLTLYKGDTHKKLLGEGGTGWLKLAQDPLEKKWYAVKFQPLEGKKSRVVRMTDKEFATLVKLGQGHGQFIYQSPTKHALRVTVMELAPGVNLHEFMYQKEMSGDLLNIYQLLDIAKGMMQAILDLHQNKGFLHCDIKLDNFVIDIASGKVSLVDYGFAFDKNDRSSKPLFGTPYHRAPEVLESQHYSEKSDVYSLGYSLARLFEFVVAEKIDGDDTEHFMNREELKQNIKVQDEGMRIEIWNLIKEMLNDSFIRRPTLEKCIQRIQALQDTLIEAPHSNTAIIDINEFFTHPESQASIMTALQTMDHVILIDNTNKFTEIELMTLCKKLQDNGIFVSDQLYQDHEAKLVDLITAMPERLQEKPIKIQNLFYVTSEETKLPSTENLHTIYALKDKKLQDYKNELNAIMKTELIPTATRGKYIEYLESERNRLDIKYKKASQFSKQACAARVDAIDKEIAWFKQKDINPTYEEAARRMKQLQSRMITTSKFASCIGLNRPVSGKKKVDDLEKKMHIHKSAQSTPRTR